MKRTLKRGSKGLEIVKKETNESSIDLRKSHAAPGVARPPGRLLSGVTRGNAQRRRPRYFSRRLVSIGRAGGRKAAGRWQVHREVDLCLARRPYRLHTPTEEEPAVRASAGLCGSIVGGSTRHRYCSVWCRSRVGSHPHTHSRC
jgi:hypothetical protein